MLHKLAALPTDIPKDYNETIDNTRRAFVAADTARWVNLHETGLQLGRPDFVQKDFDLIWRRCHASRIKEAVEEPRKTWRRPQGAESPQTIDEVQLDMFEPIPQICIDPLGVLGDTLQITLPSPMNPQNGSPSWERPFREVVLSDQSEEVFVWMFWLVFIVAFRKDSPDEENSWETWKTTLECVRQGVSKRFANLCVLASFPGGGACIQGAADILRRYPLVLAEAISAGFRREFPESLEVRRSEFAELCHRRVSQEINGFAYHAITIDSFRTSGFKGQGGNSRLKRGDGVGGDGLLGDRTCTPPKAMTTTQLSPFLQRQCHKSQIFTVRDPGHRVRFQTPTGLGKSRSMPDMSKKPGSKENQAGSADGAEAGTASQGSPSNKFVSRQSSLPQLPKNSFNSRRDHSHDPEHDALQLTDHHSRLISTFMNGRPRVVLAEKYEAKRRAKEKNQFKPPSLQRRNWG